MVAREESDFAAFAPYLEHNFELARRYVDCHAGTDGFECAYDVLLDDYEPQMKTSTVAALFAELRDELVPLIAAVSSHADAVDDSARARRLPDRAPAPRWCDETVALMGFRPDGWRIDDTVHPFAISVGRRRRAHHHPLGRDLLPDGPVRRDARVRPRAVRGGDPRRSCAARPLGGGESLGMHESQSRMWENMVGRGRPFCTVLAPRIAELLGGPLADLDADALYRAVNRVNPSYIRVEADEATYALHIILRFELEQQLLDGHAGGHGPPRGVERPLQGVFGLEVDDDANGVLQDVHWSAGLIGYFPTYALGNLIAGQLWELAHTQMPDLDEQIAAGELAPLREWLGEHVHRHGSKFPTAELLEREGAGPISVAPFVALPEAQARRRLRARSGG